MSNDSQILEFKQFTGRVCDIFVFDESINEKGEKVASQYMGSPFLINERGIFFDVLDDSNAEDYDVAFEPWANIRGIYRHK